MFLPPAVVDAAMEELFKSRHKRADLFRVVVIPRLMAPRWRRLFNKVCDFTCVVSPGPSFWPTNPGSSSKPHCWWRWVGKCGGCLRQVKEMEGIFCGNFSASRNGLPPCSSAWHGACYTYRGATRFPMPAIVDEAGNPWHKEEDRQRWMMQGVEGSHLCIPFQCKLCWYRNIERKDPAPGRDDLYVHASGKQTWMQCWESPL
jgi:hypothetical protein